MTAFGILVARRHILFLKMQISPPLAVYSALHLSYLTHWFPLLLLQQSTPPGLADYRRLPCLHYA